jgi:hypothetical protein
VKRYLIIAAIWLLVMLAVAGVLKRSINKTTDRMQTIQEEQVALIDSILD